MGAVLLTGATGFVGREILSRFLERDNRHVYALVRADDDDHAAGRLPAHERLTAVAGDIERPGLGLADGARDRVRDEVTNVVHCAASVSFDLPLEESRTVNVEGTRNVLELARSCTRLERFSYVSTAYVAGEPGGIFREDELHVGQRFRNPYELSKFEAEVALRREGAGLPLQILRPSIVVGDSTTGRTTSFNVLYGPLKALARGRIPAIPARRDSPVDIVPVDYVADRVHELATGGPNGTFHLVAGQERDHRGPPARDVVPAARAVRAHRAAPGHLPAPRPPPAAPQVPRTPADGGLLPVLRDAGAVRRPPARARPEGGDVLPPARPLRAASGLGTALALALPLSA